jgi:CPA2 family monovalent cation:H+ antiporter-2
MILAGALLSIAVNPLMYKTTRPAENLLRKIPEFWRRLDRHGDGLELPDAVSSHVVVIGYGRVGQHIVNVLGNLDVPLLVVDSSVERVDDLMERGIPALYGDAANSEVLGQANLNKARLLVVTTPDDAATGIIVAAARSEAPDLHIVARAASDKSVSHLYSLGAFHVIHPELEGGLQIVRRTLLELGFSLRKVQQYTDAVRSDRYNLAINTNEERHFLNELLMASDNIGLSWVPLDEHSELVGKTLVEAKLRELTGASIVAISRSNKLIANPDPTTVLISGDVIGMIGSDENIDKAKKVFSRTPPSPVQ